MDDPKIRYDIAAHTEGGGEVDKLTASLEKLDQAIDPATAARAQELAAELQRLGAQQQAVARFQELGAATEKARADLTAADAAVAALRSEIEASGAPTTAQAGRLEKLGAAAATARADVQAQTAALDASRGRLAALGVDAESAAKAEADLAAATRNTRAELAALGTSLQGVNARQLVDELRQLGQQQQAVQQFRDLGTATDKARAAVTSAEQALEAYRGRIAGIEAPTAAQVNTQQRLGFAVDDARAKFAAQSAALEDAGGKLAVLGIETGNLASAEERLRTATQGTLTQIEALGRTQAAVQRFQELAAATAEARAALVAADGAIDTFRAGMSSATAPTAAEAVELERLTAAARAAQVAVQQQALAQAAAGTALRAAGVDTDRLIASQARARDQLTGTAAATQQVTAQLAAERAEIDRVTAAWQTLGVRSSAAVQAEVTQVKAALAQIQAISKDPIEIRLATDAAQAKLRALGGEISGTVTASVGGLITKFGALGAAIATVGFAAKPIYDLAAQTETLRRVLTQIEGSAEGAERQMAFLRQTAQTAGVSVSAISDSFVKFESAARSSGISTQVVNDVFAATTRAAGNLGLSSEKVTLILDALGQMASKGTVSMEELRQQLGDSLPGALGLAAKGLGLTQAELIKLVESGQLLSRDLLPALAKALNDVGGSGAQVEGLVAGFNRLKNAVVDAGQSLLEGALGQGAGVALGFLDKVLRGLLASAVGVGEIFNILAKSVGVVVTAASGGISSLAEFNSRLEKVFDDSAASMSGFMDRTFKAGAAAKQAGADAAAAGQDVAKGATAYDTAATAATGAAQAHTAVGTAAAASGQAHAAAGTAASTSAQAHTALAGATTAAAGAATNATVSWAKLSVDYATVTTEMERQVKLSEKTVMSKKLEGEAAIGLAKISGDTFTALQAEAAAAEGNAAATLNLSAARQTEVAVLKAQLDAETTLAKQLGDPDGTRAKQIEGIQKSLEAKTAEAESSKQLAAQTEAESNARALAIKTYGDNSGALNELRKAYEYAKGAVDVLKIAQTEGLATQEEVSAAERRAAAAANLYRDAVNDVATATTRKNAAIAASSSLTQAALGLDAARARSVEAVATSLGNEGLATEAKIRQKRIEIDVIEAATSATLKQADASIAALQVEREAISATDPLLTQKQQEIDLKIRNIEVTKLEAAARQAGIPSILAEIDALTRRNAVVVNSAGFNSTGGTGLDKDLGRTQNLSAADYAALSPQQRYNYDLNKGVRDETSAANAMNHTAADNTGLSSLLEKRKKGTLTAADLATAQAVFDAAKSNLTLAQSSSTQYSAGGFASAQSDYNSARTLLDLIKGLAKKEPSSSGAAPATATPSSAIVQPSASAASALTAAARTVNVNLNVAGQGSYVMQGTQAEAEKLMRALEAAARVAS